MRVHGATAVVRAAGGQAVGLAGRYGPVGLATLSTVERVRAPGATTAGQSRSSGARGTTPGAYQRLAVLKARIDPDNLFNHGLDVTR